MSNCEQCNGKGWVSEVKCIEGCCRKHELIKRKCCNCDGTGICKQDS